MRDKNRKNAGEGERNKDETKIETPEKKATLPDVPQNTQASTEASSVQEQRPNNLIIPAGRKALGYKVYTARGDYLGRVVSVTNNADGEHYAVKGDGKQKTYDVRAAEDSFKEIDAESKKMVVIKWK